MDKDLLKYALKDLKNARRNIRKQLAEENGKMGKLALSSIGHISSIDPSENNAYYGNLSIALDAQQEVLEVLSGAIETLDCVIDDIKEVSND